MPGVAEIPFGDPRHPIRTSQQPCEWCHQRFSAHAYQWQLNKKRFCSRLCVEQKRSNDYASAKRFCADCQLFKIAADFSFQGKGKTGRQRLPYCKWCEHKNKRHRQCNGPLRQADQACKVCNGPIVARAYKKTLRTLLTCSKECASINRRRETVECQLCQKTLPFRAFAQTENRILRPYCKKCDEQEMVIERGFVGLRPSYHMLLCYIRAHAQRYDKPFDLSTRDAKRLWNQGCELCDGKVSKFVHTQRGEKIDKTTVRAMCRACAVLDKAFPLGTDGLIEQACRIARHRGAPADEPEDQGRAR